jgi:hypothetical protein
MSAKPAFAHSFELLKNQCVQIVSQMHELVDSGAHNTSDDSAGNASPTGSHGSYASWGSDSEQTFYIDDMKRFHWHEPDADLTNSAHITDLKNKLDDAWKSTGFADEYLADINAARAACAWLLCTLLQANFPQSQQPAMDLTHELDDIKQDIRTAFVKHIDLRTELQTFKKETTVTLKTIVATIIEIQTLTHQQQKTTNARIDLLFSKLQVTIPPKKKGYLWAEMPPAAHTLPGLLAQLERPDTQ